MARQSDAHGRGTAIPALLLLLFAAQAFVLPAQAQSEDGGRPTIGLALGGGGAKGGAHVGVLKVMEELHIPIDYISGTSIGAIVGGLYASGMTAAELEEALASVDWNEAMRDKPPRRDLAFRRKEEDARYLFDFEVGVGKGGLKFPAGLVSGQNLYFLLQSLTIPVADVQDFDKLPIPFRAVATDVNAGLPYVLKDGYLATAMRASMAIPGFFSPVELDGRILVDGGLVNNLPVKVARAMGADIVIAIDLGAPLSTQEVGDSIVQVFQQTMRMLTRPNVEPSILLADLVLNPGVSGFGTMSFGEIQQIMDMGEAYAREQIPVLEQFSIPEDEWLAHRATQADPVMEPVQVDFVEFVGNERVDDRIVENRIRLRPGAELDMDVVGEDLARLWTPLSRQESKLAKDLDSGEPVDLRVLYGDLRRIYGLGDFEQVDFRFEERVAEAVEVVSEVETEDGTETVTEAEAQTGIEKGIVIGLHEKSWGPNYLHFGMQLGADFDGDTELELLFDLTKTQINARSAEWRTDILLGRDRGILSEFYQPLDFSGKWFVAPRVDLISRLPRLWLDGERVAELRVNELDFGLDLGYQVGIYGELRLGLIRGIGDVGLETGVLPPEIESLADFSDIDFGGIRFLGRADRLDNVNIPRRGGRSRLYGYQSLESLGADDDYLKLEWEGTRFFSKKRNTFFLAGRAGWSPGSTLPIYDLFTLGGFGSFSGLADDERRGQYVGVARVGYYYNLFGSWFLGGWAEAGNVWQFSEDVGFDDVLIGGTVILAKETALGPIYVAWGQTEDGRGRFYFILGRTL